MTVVKRLGKEDTAKVVYFLMSPFGIFSCAWSYKTIDEECGLEGWNRLSPQRSALNSPGLYFNCKGITKETLFKACSNTPTTIKTVVFSFFHLLVRMVQVMDSQYLWPCTLWVVGRNLLALFHKMTPSLLLSVTRFEVSSQWRATVKTQSVQKHDRPRTLEVTGIETTEFKVGQGKWCRI